MFIESSDAVSSDLLFSSFCCSSGLLPNAVLPPSLDHNYAQWQEREEMACAEHRLSMKIIPAPCSKAPGESDFPIVPPHPPLQLTHGEEHYPISAYFFHNEIFNLRVFVLSLTIPF